jgi:hypothetical protein
VDRNLRHERQNLWLSTHKGGSQIPRCGVSTSADLTLAESKRARSTAPLWVVAESCSASGGTPASAPFGLFCLRLDVESLSGSWAPAADGSLPGEASSGANPSRWQDRRNARRQRYRRRVCRGGVRPPLRARNNFLAAGAAEFRRRLGYPLAVAALQPDLVFIRSVLPRGWRQTKMVASCREQPIRYVNSSPEVVLWS